MQKNMNRSWLSNILLGIGGFTLFLTIDVIIHSPLRENQHVRHFNFLDFPTLIFIISLALFFVLLSSPPQATSLFAYRYLICQKFTFFVNLWVSISYGSDNNDPSFYMYSFHEGATIKLVLRREVFDSKNCPFAP
jgi:uncharacterized membrane protein